MTRFLGYRIWLNTSVEKNIDTFTVISICIISFSIDRLQWLPAWDLEPCLVGIQPFIDVETFTVNPSCVAILSKSLNERNKYDTCGKCTIIVFYLISSYDIHLINYIDLCSLQII